MNTGIDCCFHATYLFTHFTTNSIEAMTDSKRPTQWPLRFQSPEEFPNLIKFSESVDWANLIVDEQQLLLYFNEEELKEEEKEKNTVKDEEYYKRRRRQRHSYHKKQTLVLESSSNDIHFEGRECNLDLVEMVSEGSSANVSQKASKSKEEFRYVLLQFVKREGMDGSHDPEINVIPVGNMFALRKTGKPADETLDEIDEKFNEERELEQKHNARFNKLNRAPGKKSNDDENKNETTDGKDSFDYALGKALSKRKPEAQKTRFSFANSNVRDGNTPKFVIDENGIYNDEHKEFEWCKGEYNVRYADDEEEHITVEQQQNQNREEQEISSSLRFDDKYDSDTDENEEDEDEENAVVGDDTSFNTTGSRSGYVNNEMLDGATKIRKELQNSQLEQQKIKDEYNKVLSAQLPSSTITTKKILDISASNPLKSAMKRKLNDSVIKVEEQPKKQVKIANSESAALSNEIDLSDSGIKMYIQHRGGRVTVKDIYEVNHSSAKCCFFAH